MKKCGDIHIRDPFVLLYDGKYYMYGTRGETCWGKATGFDVFISDNMIDWEGPIEVFHNDGNFWADRHYWAPEVHYYNGSFYMFASFKKEGLCRGTQILKSESPLGPFLPYSDGPLTPRDWDCLDGTFYVSNSGQPYMVFCHEWLQVNDGEIWAIALSKDLKKTEGKPFLLLKASWQPGVTSVSEGKNSFVTDGPCIYRLKSGRLLMLWSTHSKNGYCEAIAISDNNEIDGNWKVCPDFLFEKDGGHGMIFKGDNNTLYFAMHQPNVTPMERPHFYKIKEKANTIALC